MTAQNGHHDRLVGDRCLPCRWGDHDDCTYGDEHGCGCSHPTCLPRPEDIDHDEDRR